MKPSRIAIAFCLWVLLLSYLSFAAGPAPTVSILNPKPGTKTLPSLISLRQTTNDFKVQLQVWDDIAITANTVRLWYCHDSGSSNPETPATCGGAAYGSANLTINANYNCGANCAVYEGNISSMSAGNSYYIYGSANSADGTGESRQNRTGNDARYVYVKLLSPKTGTGSLLARDSSSQICMDCHNVSSHSSQSTDTSYGNWQTVCLECHTQHDTNNIYLIRRSIAAPNGASRTVNFYNATGDADNSYVDSTPPGGNPNGICQVCHTRTQSSGGANRWRFNGNADSHYTAAAGTQPCRNCHSHSSGFKGAGCDGCHDYDTTGGGANWGKGSTGGLNGGVFAWGAHVKHINHLKTRNSAALNANGDLFGGTAFNLVCGVCHPQINTADHGPDGGSANRFINFSAGSNAYQFGAGLPSFNTAAANRSCSSIECHFKTTPQW